MFWKQIDPLDAHGQFCDRGQQYSAGIFYTSEEQKQLAQESKATLEKSGEFAKPLVTEILEAGVFYAAEEYHQDYAANHPDDMYVRANSLPHARKVRDKHPDLIDPAAKKGKK